MDFIFWLAIINNVFSIFGFTGVLNHQKELVTGFFAYNAVQMIVSFHYFVDVCADVGIRSAPLPTADMLPLEHVAHKIHSVGCMAANIIHSHVLPFKHTQCTYSIKV